MGVRKVWTEEEIEKLTDLYNEYKVGDIHFVVLVYFRSLYIVHQLNQKEITIVIFQTMLINANGSGLWSANILRIRSI